MCDPYSGLSILVHGVISPPHTKSWDKYLLIIGRPLSRHGFCEFKAFVKQITLLSSNILTEALKLMSEGGKGPNLKMHFKRAFYWPVFCLNGQFVWNSHLLNLLWTPFHKKACTFCLNWIFR